MAQRIGETEEPTPALDCWYKKGRAVPCESDAHPADRRKPIAAVRVVFKVLGKKWEILLCGKCLNDLQWSINIREGTWSDK